MVSLDGNVIDKNAEQQGGIDIRWFCLVAFLLATPASYTTRLGAALCDFNLASSGHGQRMLARTTPFPWNVDGSTRLVMLLLMWLSVIGDVVLQIIVLVEFLNLGDHVHVGMVVVVVVMAAGVVLGGEQTKGKRFSRTRWWWWCCCCC